MTTAATLAPVSWRRMIGAVEKVRDRLRRTVQALEDAGVPYAVAGGNAVAAWVSRVDESAVRNTRDVDILLRRDDLVAAANALKGVGFVQRHAAGPDMFLDGPAAKALDAVHVVFANERVRAEYAVPAPDVGEAEPSAAFRLISLEALVRMKLTSFRDKDRVHLRDLAGVGLVDDTWPVRFQEPLSGRLRQILANPED